MKRKRMIKLLMSVGFDRNAAVREADACDGRTSHIRIMNRLCVELLRGIGEGGAFLKKGPFLLPFLPARRATGWGA